MADGMAHSPSHQFGQAVGDLIESSIRSLLASVADTHRLYLDYQARDRKARRGKRVIWEDGYGNKHNLDYVLESGGSDTQLGTPIAFVECAWRSYTKHSRNKAQEIQGAVLPVAEKYQHIKPFLGAVIAGRFTADSLAQLKSLGFRLAHLPYETVVDAFESTGLNIRFSEQTPDAIFQQAVEQMARLSNNQKNDLGQRILSRNRNEIDLFCWELNQHLARRMERIVIIPLYGNPSEFHSAVDAIRFLENHVEHRASGNFRSYEVIVRYSNGDKIECSFQERARAKEFIETHLSK